MARGQILWKNLEWHTPLHLVAGQLLLSGEASISNIWDRGNCKYQAYDCRNLNGFSVDYFAVAQYMNEGLIRVRGYIAEPESPELVFRDGETGISSDDPRIGAWLAQSDRVQSNFYKLYDDLVAHFNELYGNKEKSNISIPVSLTLMHYWRGEDKNSSCNLALKTLGIHFEFESRNQLALRMELHMITKQYLAALGR